MNDACWALTTFFNPAGYRNKRRNYRRFREGLRAQGARLLTVELAFGDTAFELAPGDADQLLQVRAASVLWQKERLLNLGLDHLPEACAYVAWIDCDVLFLNPRWLDDAIERLQAVPIVQLYEYAVRLPRGGYRGSVETLAFGRGEAQRHEGCAAQAARGATRDLATLMGHCGFAWAGRRAVLEQPRFYDRAIIGGGDLCMAAAFFGVPLDANLATDAMRRDYRRWAEAIGPAVGGQVGYVPGGVLHLWHGHRMHRFYASRARILRRFAFDPNADLVLNPNGCWEWASEKSRLHQVVREYFQIRNEEGRWLGTARQVLLNPWWASQILFGALQARIAGWLKRWVPGAHRWARWAYLRWEAAAPH